MSEKPETHADIIAEMRTKAECAKPYDDGIVMMLNDYADRFDAAHKREREASGNTAALREALNRLVIASEGFLKTHSAKYYVDTTEALDKAKAALADTSNQNTQEEN